MQTKILATLYRGGTSKGPLFLAEDLPKDRETLSRVLLAAMGSPHPRQVDGIGGAESLTSKIAILSTSNRPGVDVDFLFVQVNPNSPIVDFSSNCGNMLSAVGPFVVEKGLVKADPSGTTHINIYNFNTDSHLSVQIATPNGDVTYDGDTAIDGVPGTAAMVRENFAGTVGSKTKKLLPTGNRREEILGVEVTCIDVAVPTVLIPASAVGKTGTESKAELDADQALIARLNDIRIEAGKRMGMGDCTDFVVPKPLMLAAPSHGGTITSRDFVPFNCHATHSVTGAMALATACAMEGTVAQKISGTVQKGTVTIEHPSGVMDIEVDAGEKGDTFEVREAGLVRTCRKLFEGFVFVPRAVWDGSNRASSCDDIAAGLTS
ncbi:4-oxalomesaconate tautomerase [Cupriavidus oxalaticus]|uniref:4-oxalomesaconate tautomerase n=1 Tax=Cupriavidus oxalaticus TaxID=96344 RepID=UPI004034A0CE